MGNHARILGLCGKAASGKNVVAHLLSQKGYEVIDVDSLGHLVLEQEKGKVLQTFGKGILGEDGKINRQALGKIVFSDPLPLKALEAIVHPAMVKRVLNQIEENPHQNFVINAALLYPMGLDRVCDKILVLKACPLKRLERLIKGRSLPFGYAVKILVNQRKLVPKNSKNVIIGNNGSLSRLESLVADLIL
jgi:dephospho-CoA kinase